MVPSATFVVRRPRDEVAMFVRAPVPPLDETSPYANEVAPVPPPATVSVPDVLGVNVSAPFEGTIVSDEVRPFVVLVVVENVMAVAVVEAYPEPRAVRYEPGAW